MNEKPLFIPLNAKWFEAFERGEKNTEYRVLGPRWNASTCSPGRAVTLSYGYGKARRMHGVIKRFEIVGPDADPAIAEIYPAQERIAAITVELDKRHHLSAKNDLPAAKPQQRITASAMLTLDYHLEAIIWDDAKPGERLNAAEVMRRMASPTPDQLERAKADLKAKEELIKCRA